MPLLNRLRRRPGRALLMGFGLLLLGVLHLTVLQLETVNRFFYPLVWWSFIVTLDAFNGLWDRNVLLGRPGNVLPIAGVSMLLWFVFEVYNLWLANWYYVGVSSSWLVHWPLVAVSFATVLPGLWVVQQSLDQQLPSGWFRGSRWDLRLWQRRVLLGVGILGSFGPFLAPRLCFPLVWVGPGLIVETLEYRRGGPCFLGHVEAGRYRDLVTWMIAGGVCGFLWEFWNSLTVTHWIYTVPFLEDWRLFEMPLLGYLGFLPFAPMTWRLYVSLRRILPSWPRVARLGFWVGVLAFSLLTLMAMQHHTVVSRYPDLRKFTGWTQRERRVLKRHDLRSPWQALKTLRDSSIRRKVNYLRFAGLGTEVGNCLWQHGIRSVEAIRRRSPSTLAQRLQACQGGSRDVWRRRALDWQYRDLQPRVPVLPVQPASED